MAKDRLHLDGNLLTVSFMTDPQVLQQNMEFLFRQWWAESYSTPPGTHAVMTHSAFAASIYKSCVQGGMKLALAHLSVHYGEEITPDLINKLSEDLSINLDVNS